MKNVERKKVEVTLPVVKLRVDDLSYLQGIANREGKTKCSIPDGNYHRLILLGLIEKVEIPADPKLMAKFEQDRIDRLNAIRAIVNAKVTDWEAIRSLTGYWSYSKPQSTFDTRITESGRKLIANGSAQVEVKASCK